MMLPLAFIDNGNGGGGGYAAPITRAVAQPVLLAPGGITLPKQPPPEVTPTRVTRDDVPIPSPAQPAPVTFQPFKPVAPSAPPVAAAPASAPAQPAASTALPVAQSAGVAGSPCATCVFGSNAVTPSASLVVGAPTTQTPAQQAGALGSIPNIGIFLILILLGVFFGMGERH